VELLEKEAVEHGGVIFIGATLWTNCNNGDSLTVWTLKSSMNDYRVVQNHYADQGLYHKLTPEFTFREHIKTLEAFKPLLTKNVERPVVMITHHAPSFLSVADVYKDEYHMNGGYASDLSEFILDYPQIKFWLHGHMHNVSDYQIGDTRILCNPRGYVGHEAQSDNFKVKSFSVFPEEHPVIVRGSWE
jgi:RNAse (barnase) inhibitor barstar